MRLRVFSVRDIKADAFGRPGFAQSNGAALRSFQDECNRVAEDNMMSRHPEDFELYELGSWDDETGQFDLLERPRQLGVGSQMRLNNAS